MPIFAKVPKQLTFVFVLDSLHIRSCWKYLKSEDALHCIVHCGVKGVQPHQTTEPKPMSPLHGISFRF